MNRDTLKGNWKEFKGRIKQRWGKLTDDDLKQIDGEREVLLGRMQQRYGWAKDRAERELDGFLRAGGQSDEGSVAGRDVPRGKGHRPGI